MSAATKPFLRGFRVIRRRQLENTRYPKKPVLCTFKRRSGPYLAFSFNSRLPHCPHCTVISLPFKCWQNWSNVTSPPNIFKVAVMFLGAIKRNCLQLVEENKKLTKIALFPSFDLQLATKRLVIIRPRVIRHCIGAQQHAIDRSFERLLPRRGRRSFGLDDVIKDTIAIDAIALGHQFHAVF